MLPIPDVMPDADPTQISFQVILGLLPIEAMTDEELEAESERAMEPLLTNAKGIALGPVFGVNFVKRSVEIEFTLEGQDVGEFLDKLKHISAVLHDAGFIFQSTTASVDTGEKPEPEPVLVGA